MTTRTPRRRRVRISAAPPTPAEIAAKEAGLAQYAAEQRDQALIDRLVFHSPDLPTEAEGEWPTDLVGLAAAQADHHERQVRAAWDPATGERILTRAIGVARNEAEYQAARSEGGFVAEMGTIDPEKVYVGYAETYRGALAREKREATNKAKAYARTLLTVPVVEVADDLDLDLVTEWFWQGYRGVVDDQYTERTAPSPALAAEIERLFAAWPA
ncbi:hypothetical protein [Gordonia amicalis]|uniref:hypothetical protein n=1 Tax=Gordonia amicalis TaxID=89053 RepID=UPI0024B9022B|nr:hypothetical protein [Gordonia amicalis]MDJ0454091.1 hypothetical protein [Gordonia amicalis]MDV7077235.1 hypothetical protein [Gordonia amicalis]